MTDLQQRIAVHPALQAQRRRTIVVGVDGSAENEAAIRWAVDRALHARQPLALAAILDHHWPASLPDPVNAAARHGWQNLTELRARLVAENPDLVVLFEVRAGEAVRGLVGLAADRELVVLTKRGLGVVGRIMIGSVSIGVAGRSAAPVVVVPPHWDATRHRGQPIVVGRHPGGADAGTLEFAVREAVLRQVELIIVSVDEGRTDEVSVTSERPMTPAEARSPDSSTVDDLELQRIRRRHPTVRIRTERTSGRASHELLRRAASAQLLVLGRRHPGAFGFGIGSTARIVLHRAQLPVAVVPST